MTCLQLGGACSKTFSANTFKEIAELSKQHGMEMYQQQDALHLKAMEEMQTLMQSPEVFQQWFEKKQKEFNALPNNE